MAMFDNPKKELAELEAQLLKEEEWFEKELAQAKALIGDEPVKKPKTKTASNKTAPAKKSTPAAQKVRESKKPVMEEEKKPKSNKGLITLAILETLGIVGVVAYWMLFLL